MVVELSIIIPTYNEEKSVGPLIDELHDVLISMDMAYEILFVDDGSNDSTFLKLKELHSQNSNIRIIRLKRNFGQSAAMKAGFDYAQGNYIITMDADLQNDPHDIPMMLEKIKTEDLDVVCGWRHNRIDSFFKNKFSKFANGLRRILTGETIHDSGCTLRVYKKECTEDLSLYGELHRYIPAILLWKGYKIGELKTNHRARNLGKSKYNWKRLYKGFLDLLVVTFWQKFSARPIHLFGGFGIIIGFIGFIITIYLVIEKLFLGAGLSDRPLFFIGIFLAIIGMQFFALGVLADIMLKVYHGQDGKRTYQVDIVIE